MTYETRRETIGLLREAAGEQQRKANQKRMARKVLGASLGITVSQLWWAQVVCWGLSLYHVSSGIWGPFLLLEVLGSLLASAVSLGMLLTARKMNE